MEKQYVISYDIGTSSVKTVIVDTNGDVAGVTNASYPLITPQPGWAEQNAEAYWEAVCSSTKEALKNTGIPADKVIGIAFGTQWRGIIPLDAEDNILHNNIIWLDGRADKQAKVLNERLESPMFMGSDYYPKLMWVKENLPNIYEKTVVFLEVNAFLKFKATGKKAVDLTNDFIHAPDEGVQAFFDQVMDAAKLDKGKFPPMVLITDNVGGITACAAKEMGLKEGTPVFGGCGDIPAITIGSGCCSENDAHLYMGTSGWLGVINKRGSTANDVYMSIEEDRDIRLDGLKSVGASLNWAIEMLYHTENAEMGAEIFDLINKEIADIPPGSGQMIATPWLYGGYPPVPATARSVFFNMNAAHDRRFTLNAVMEGVCYQQRWMIDIYCKKAGRSIDAIRVVGGCTSSEHWMQLMADILQIPVEVTEDSAHAGAIGTAYCAFVGLGLCAGLDEVKNKIKIKKTYQPRKENAEVYNKLYKAFKDINMALEPLFNSLNQ